MTSSLKVNLRRPHSSADVKEKRISTIQNIYKEDDDDLQITKVDPNTKKCVINKTAYIKLHRSSSSGSSSNSSNRRSLNLKFKYEKPEEDLSTDEVDSTKIKYSPADFGYPKSAKLKPPLIKPRNSLNLEQNKPKDENSNDVEEREVVLRKSDSEESIHRIAKELSDFTMDNKPKERKRNNSFRKIFSGVFSTKDKKKKDDDKTKKTNENLAYNDNFKNETNFIRHEMPLPDSEQELHEEKVKEIEKKYAEMHVNRFNQIKQTFSEPRQDYKPIVKPKPKPSISDYISAPVNRYIDTSSSASTESERHNFYRDTPPRAQETYQNVTVVSPKSTTERHLPNPYQNEKASPKTIERNLNRSNSKDYPDKPNLPVKPVRFENKPPVPANKPTIPAKPVKIDDTYGTVFDSIEPNKQLNTRPQLQSPKSPSLEGSKLKLPPNREIYEVLPRVKSPIPSNRISTDKIIATELLKNSRSPTPPKRVIQTNSEDASRSDMISSKPPMSPKNPQRRSNESPVPPSDKIITNAQVHVNNTPTEYLGIRASTPVELRRSVTSKMSSPQKGDIRKSVEEYYWKELKKMKDQEDYNLYMIQMNNGYFEEPNLRRSRSLSPSQRTGHRSLSLPRDNNNTSIYGRLPHQSIPEDSALIVDRPPRRQLNYQNNFVRSTPERRSVDSLQRPIFRRGSLSKQENYDNQQNYNKKVSFSNSQAPQQYWPTRNGYTQSPPQRRVEIKRESILDDDVFYPAEPIYEQQRYYQQQNEPLYGNRPNSQYELYARRHPQNEMIYGRRLPSDSQYNQLQVDYPQDIYSNRQQVLSRPLPKPPVQSNDDSMYRRYDLHRNPVHSSQQSMTDGIYGSQKQITVRNKFCDVYGQIHDTPQKSGILMGQLYKNSPMIGARLSYAAAQPLSSVPQQQFVRGSRLTASANDIGRRYQNGDAAPRYHQTDNYPINYDNRPLPPVPKKLANRYVSDTESCSDASEIQRITQKKAKNKKRGFFGK